MTEKQGGSDVRANTTRAEPAPGTGPGAHLLTGHKWFCSAPMCDLFLTLAQAPGGLTCFLLPRVLPDGERNGLRIERLKDKLGNRSNASAEIELDGALAWQVGEAGRGVATIIEMVSATRLDCVVGSAAGMRLATVAAVHHASHRQSFGKDLVAHPLMGCVLADLALESQAATVLALRLAGAADRAGRGDEAQRGAAAGRPARRQVLGVQAHARPCGRGAGVPRRERVRGGIRDAPALPGGAAELDLGGVGQRDRARRAARARPHPGLCRCPAAPSWTSPPAATGRLDAALGQLRELLAGLESATSLEAQYRARRLAGLIAVALQAALLVRHAAGPGRGRVLRLAARSRRGRGARCAVRHPAGWARSWLRILERARVTAGAG